MIDAKNSATSQWESPAASRRLNRLIGPACSYTDGRSLAGIRDQRRVKAIATTTIAITMTAGMNQPPNSIFASRLSALKALFRN
jgi:hypothetical protein